MFHGIHGSSDLRLFVSNSGAIQTDGTPADLVTEQIGFFRVDKRGVGIPDSAQAKPTARTSPVFKLGIGRAPYAAQQAVQPIEDNFPLLTRELRAQSIVKWEGQRAQKEAHTERWALGYDGIDANKRLFAKRDYHEFKVGIRLWGGPIQKLTGNAPWLQRWYHIDKGCIDRCLDVCEENPGIADEIIADEILRKFNADYYNGTLIPISRFIKATKVRKSATPDTPVATVEATQYSISLCDDGSNSALGFVQAQYPGSKVEIAGRTGAISTYSVWRLTSQGAPAAFVNTAPVQLAVCDVCPAGYTLSPETTTYSVERVVLAGTDLSTDAAKQTYANGVGDAYEATVLRGVASVTVTPGSGYTPGTYPLTFTGGTGPGGATGTLTVAAGGALGSVTITNPGQYLTAPTVAIPAGAGAGTGGGLAVVLTPVPVSTATFVSNNGGTAIVTITVPATTPELSAIGSDILTLAGTAEAVCTPPAGSTIAWVAGLTRTTTTKKWMLHLDDTVCGQSRLAEIQAAYADLVVSEDAVSGPCGRIYVTETVSTPSLDEDCGEVLYTFYRPDAFFSGAVWQEFVTPLENPVCTTTPEETPCVAAGIIFETAVFVNPTNECLYGYYQYDLDDVDQVYAEITAVAGTDDWTMSPCYITDQVVTKLREPKFATGKGEFIRAAEKATLLQYGKVHTTNPARNAAYGVYFNAKPDEWYDVYKLTVEENESTHYVTGREGRKQRTTYAFAFPVGKGKAFEALINGYILSLNNYDLNPVIL